MKKREARVFLVEDDPMLQFVLERQLTRLGYRIEGVASNGIVAVEKILSESYDIVFMDVRLPAIDGMTATERIRTAEYKLGLHTTIVGMTAFAERKRCLDIGMDDFLKKPVLLEELDAILEKWLHAEVSGESNPLLASLKPKRFSETESRLKKIQEKIARLRKSVGLDDNPH